MNAENILAYEALFELALWSIVVGVFVWSCFEIRKAWRQAMGRARITRRVDSIPTFDPFTDIDSLCRSYSKYFTKCGARIAHEHGIFVIYIHGVRTYCTESMVGVFDLLKSFQNPTPMLPEPTINGASKS